MRSLWFLSCIGSFDNKARFFFFYKNAPAPLQQFVHFFDLFAEPLVLFSLFFSELPRTLILGMQKRFESPSTTFCGECAELALRCYLRHLHLYVRGLFHSYGVCFAFIRHIHSMRSVGGRNSAESGASGCIAFGLLPGLWGRLFRPGSEFGEKEFISQLGQDLCPEDWQRQKPKSSAIHSTAFLISKSSRCLYYIPCWFGDYPLHFTCLWWCGLLWISSCGLSARRKQRLNTDARFYN